MRNNILFNTYKYSYFKKNDTGPDREDRKRKIDYIKDDPDLFDEDYYDNIKKSDIIQEYEDIKEQETPDPDYVQ